MKKILDMSIKTWYNTYVRKDALKDIFTAGVSLNPAISVAVNDNLTALAGCISEASKKVPEIRTPVIAGGAIRDMIFGLKPKDYDIFYDVTPLPEDEREDASLYLASLIKDEISKDGRHFPFAAEFDLIEDLSGEYAESGKNTDTGVFCVYETVVPDRLWALPEADGPGNPFQVFQFIPHLAPKLSESPAEFAKTFDYGFVRAVLDPLDMAYRFDDTFVEELKARKIVVTEEKTRGRVQRWLDRCLSIGHNPPVTMDYKGKTKKNKGVKLSNRYRDDPGLRHLRNEWPGQEAIEARVQQINVEIQMRQAQAQNDLLRDVQWVEGVQWEQPVPRVRMMEPGEAGALDNNF